MIQGANLEDLEANIRTEVRRLMGANPSLELAPDFSKVLSDTMQTFSQYARDGRDPDFLRGADKAEIEWQAYFSRPQKGMEASTREMPNQTMYPISEAGPYYAVILAPGALDTNSGPVVNSNAQVLTSSKLAISLQAKGFISSCCCIFCCVFGGNTKLHSAHIGRFKGDGVTTGIFGATV